MIFFIYALDEDHALEVSGHGADKEFDSLEEAILGFEPEFHIGRSIYKIVVERVKDKQQ